MYFINFTGLFGFIEPGGGIPNAAWSIGNELVLNEIAKRVLPSEGIEIVDIYPISASTPNAHPNPWDVHFTREVNQKLADIISDFIKTSF